MNDPCDIIGIVNDLMDRYEVRTILSETRMRNMFAVYENFPAIVSHLLELDEKLKIAVGALERSKKILTPLSVDKATILMRCGQLETAIDIALEKISKLSHDS